MDGSTTLDATMVFSTVVHDHASTCPSNWYYLPPQKSLPYPLHQSYTNLDAHITILHKALKTNRETKDEEMINLLCYKLLDKESE